MLSYFKDTFKKKHFKKAIFFFPTTFHDRIINKIMYSYFELTFLNYLKETCSWNKLEVNTHQNLLEVYDNIPGWFGNKASLTPDVRKKVTIENINKFPHKIKIYTDLTLLLIYTFCMNDEEFKSL